MLNIIPAPYRWLAIAALVLAVFGFGFLKGAQHEERAEDARNLAAERATVKRTAQRTDASSKVDAKYAPILTKIQTVTKETIRYVPQFVPVADCPLSPGFRVLHDAAAEGVVPDPAGIPDAAPVAAQEAAATVTDNYGACRETATRLEGLQEWVREQLRLNDQRNTETVDKPQ